MNHLMAIIARARLVLLVESIRVQVSQRNTTHSLKESS
jgi:hypothetical protein